MAWCYIWLSCRNTVNCNLVLILSTNRRLQKTGKAWNHKDKYTFCPKSVSLGFKLFPGWSGAPWKKNTTEQNKNARLKTDELGSTQNLRLRAYVHTNPYWNHRTSWMRAVPFFSFLLDSKPYSGNKLDSRQTAPPAFIYRTVRMPVWGCYSNTSTANLTFH